MKRDVPFILKQLQLAIDATVDEVVTDLAPLSNHELYQYTLMSYGELIQVDCMDKGKSEITNKLRWTITWKGHLFYESDGKLLF